MYENEEIQVGDIVQIVNSGNAYSTYTDFYEKYGMDRTYWTHGFQCNDVMHIDMTVIAVEVHTKHIHKKVAIVEHRRDDGVIVDYIMGLNGLRFICNGSGNGKQLSNVGGF